MSKYTTELRFICESIANLPDPNQGMSVNAVIRVAAPLIFNFPFPMFDEDDEGNSAYKTILTEKILRHYYTREICEETYGLWKLRLNDKMNIIMPYYNQLYKSALLEFNPFYDVDVIRKHEGSSIGEENKNQNSISSSELSKNNKTENSGTNNITANGHTSDGNNRWDLYSDTPQGGTNGITGDTFDNNVYLTNARNIKDNRITDNSSNEGGIFTTNAESNDKETGQVIGSNIDSTNISNLNQYIEHVVGKQGSENYSDLLIKFRKTFINIDKMVIDELETLFFGLW